MDCEQPTSAQVQGSARERLPNRRPHTLVDFEHDGRTYTGGLGYFDDGRLAEIFLNTSGKAGTDLAIAAAGALEAPDHVARIIAGEDDGSADT